MALQVPTPPINQKLLGPGGTHDTSWTTYHSTLNNYLNKTVGSNGFEPSPMTSSQRDGMTGVTAPRLIYNTDINKLQIYTGSTWETVTSS